MPGMGSPAGAASRVGPGNLDSYNRSIRHHIYVRVYLATRVNNKLEGDGIIADDSGAVIRNSPLGNPVSSLPIPNVDMPSVLGV